MVVDVAYVIWSGLKLTQYQATIDYHADLEPKDSLKGCSCEWLNIDLKTWQKKNGSKDQDKRQKLRKQTNKGNISKCVSQFEL